MTILQRTGLISFGGQDVTVLGEDIVVGQSAPDFTVTGQDWRPSRGMADTQGKVRIIAAVPSLDTPVCDRETHRFNEAAVALGKDVAILVVSMDLPFAQKRWCGATGVEQVTVLSDHKDADFGVKYGVLMKEVRLLRRAVFVVDRQGMVVYADYMPALGDEPDYDVVLEAARKALG